MTLSTHGDGASSSAPSALQWKYDVFLSFRGGDTRNSFTATLYEKLLEQGITRTFLDDADLPIGRKISELFLAIEQSRLAIIVISPNYGSSKWCLNELVKILQCMETEGLGVLPIFYSVEPSDVGDQSGSFGKAFSELEQKCKNDNEMVEGWKAALRKVAKIKGCASENRREPDLIKEIVEKVRTEVGPVSLEPAEKLVGIDSKLEQLDLLIDVESNDVRFIGIWGMSGIGKTTIAKKVYERILHKFEVKSFRDRVREVSKAHGLADLQRRLSNNLMNRNVEDWDIHEEARLRYFLREKKVLLILDDVDHKSQLENLCGNPTWFGQGSRIIVTTTNEHLLIAHGVQRRFKVQELNDDDALKLFSLRAFEREFPDRTHMDLSKRYVNYANGLPLALEVLGSLLHERGPDAFSSQLDKMKVDFNGEIMDSLRIGYEGLDKQGKDIFLDIACFFKGKYKDQAVEILKSCGFHPGIDIDVLMKRSLITIADNMVWMHDLLQEMGRAIVRQQSQEPGERSRLWLSGDIFHVLSQNTGTAAVEGIVLDMLESKEGECKPDAFSKMFMLRLLKVHNLHLPDGLNCLPNSLRFLEWRGYPLPYLPPSFKPEGLVELSLCHSSIQQLWDGTKNFDKLKVIKLRHSKHLRRADFEGVQNLEILDLEGCESLVEIDSIGVLEKLKFLNLKDCISLKSLPEEIKMEFLQIFILSGCSSVKKIPEFVGRMEHLWKICLDRTAIENVHSSIEGLTSLSLLDMRDCRDLNSLPTNIGNLKSLKHLHVSGCSKLNILPESIGKLELLEEIDASGTAIIELPSSFAHLKNLTSLIFPGPKRPSQDSQQPGRMSFAKRSFFRPLAELSSLRVLNPSDRNLSEGAIPSDIRFFRPLAELCSLMVLNLSDRNLSEGVIPSSFRFPPSLLSLDLSGNDFRTLPGNISQLPKLESLCLSRCRRLQHLPALSSDVNLQVTADDCTSLETLKYPSNLDRLNTSYFNFINCFGMLDSESYNRITFTMLQRYLKRALRPGERYEIVIRGSEIPRWFSHQRVGASLSVELSPDWHNNKWVGYAVCAVFQVSGDGWELSCVLEVDGKEEYPAPQLSTDVQPVSDHLWLFYVSRDISFGTDWQNSCSRLIFSLQNSGPCSVTKCGVRLVYEQDVDKFNPDDQSSSVQGAITKRSYRDSDGKGPNGRGDFDEESHSKRFKRT